VYNDSQINYKENFDIISLASHSNIDFSVRSPHSVKLYQGWVLPHMGTKPRFLSLDWVKLSAGKVLPNMRTPHKFENIWEDPILFSFPCVFYERGSDYLQEINQPSLVKLWNNINFSNDDYLNFFIIDV
jgi:hypothetical protein